MPIVKQISIHKTPLKMIQYILNGEKNDKMKFATGINCSTNVKDAYEEFRQNFEAHTGERFYKFFSNVDASEEELAKTGSKERVRLHHYIQSFAPGEVTPEEAHSIGLEWAKRVFGDNRQILCSTHIDKGHIHNHFAVAAIGLDGTVWHSNLKTLARCRKISDEIALARGLSIIENPKSKKEAKVKGYVEWSDKNNGKLHSFKTKMRDDFDKLIMQNDVDSVDKLIVKMRELGYTIEKKKYITVKAPKQKKPMRSFRLGDGYSVEDLQYRIEHKEKEMSLYAIFKNHSGIQAEYALYIQRLQIAVFRHKPHRTTYYELRHSADLLNYITENGITSKSEFENAVNKISEDCFELEKQHRTAAAKVEKDEKLINDINDYHRLIKKEQLTDEEKIIFKQVRYVGVQNIPADRIAVLSVSVKNQKRLLSDLSDRLEAAKTERDKSRAAYKTFLSNSETKDYTAAVNEQAELENAERVKNDAERESGIHNEQERQKNEETII